jgi:hypothetical protein
LREKYYGRNLHIYLPRHADDNQSLRAPAIPRLPGLYCIGQEGLQGKRGRYLLGFFVLAGVLTMTLALGGIIALLSVSVGQVHSIIIPIADLNNSSCYLEMKG